MTTQRIIYPNADGSINIIIPAESIELALEDLPPNVEYKIVDVTDIPEDRTFRNAWEWVE